MPYKDPEAKKKWEREHRSAGAQKRRAVWWGYLYPDSAPDDWETRIRESGREVLWVRHDRDVDAAGAPKKEHVHVLVRFDHAVDRATAVAALGEYGVLEKSVQYRDSWRACARYLVHMDDPDKYQYDPSDVRECGGADWRAAVQRSSDKYRVVKEMCLWVQETGCTDFSALMDHAMDAEPEWWAALCDSSAVVMREYIRSKRGARKQRERAEREAYALARGILRNEGVRRKWDEYLRSQNPSERRDDGEPVPTAADGVQDAGRGVRPDPSGVGPTTSHTPGVPTPDPDPGDDFSDIARIAKGVEELWGTQLLEVSENGD